MKIKSLIDHANNCLKDEDILNNILLLTDYFRIGDWDKIALESGRFVENAAIYLSKKTGKCDDPKIIKVPSNVLSCLYKHFKDNGDFRVLLSVLKSIYTVRSSIVHETIEPTTEHYYLLLAVYWAFIKLLELYCKDSFEGNTYLAEIFAPVETLRMLTFEEGRLIVLDDRRYTLKERILLALYHRNSWLTLKDLREMLGEDGKRRNVSPELSRLKKEELIIHKDRKWKISTKGKKEVLRIIRGRASNA